MKRVFIFFILAVCSFAVQAQKTNKNLGIIIGDPTGISGKYWLNDANAIDAAISWRIGTIGESVKTSGKASLTIHSTYLWHDYSMIKVQNGSLPFYFGVGGTITLQDNIALGVRGAAGLDYIFENLPLDIFLELSPSFYLIPSSTIGVGFGVGIRYQL